MRIAYLAHVNDGRQSGVVAKIGAQLGVWREHGHEARLFLYTNDDGVAAGAAAGAMTLGRYTGPWSRLTTMTRLVAGIRAYRPDIVYVRWDLYYPPMEWLPRRPPLVVEINTDDLAEYRLGWRRHRHLYNRLTRRRVLGRASGLIFVTGELSRGPSFARLRGRRAVIGNAVDLRAFPEQPPPRNDRPTLVFVGSPWQPWQGVDKVLRLAARRPQWQFELAGPVRREATSNVRWHGTVPREEAVRLMGGADVGIGTLALHRKGLAEASALKLREYLAVGLPVVYGNEDRDVDPLEPWVLRLANTESNVEDGLERIDRFVDEVRGRRVPRAQIGHLDAAAKERTRLDFFQELVDAAHR
jgi:glycosyltransferase involved in cell wall biosynthesis